MMAPSSEHWQRVLGLIESWDSLPNPEVQSRLRDMEREGVEEPVVIAYLRLNYRIPSEPQPFNAGERVGGRYTILRKIGQGGMGVVYAALQDLTEKEVALKLIHPGLHSKELGRRFEQEIKILGRLEHRGIVRILEAGVNEGDGALKGGLFFAMDYIRGEPITEYARKAELNLVERVDLTIEVCEALRYAHDRRIVHRDLKPGNILVPSDGAPVLLDFGLADFVERMLHEKQAAIGRFCSGTPAYMSPEQAGGGPAAWQAREAVDVYSAGVVFYELLTGRLPYPAESGVSKEDLRRMIRETEPAPLRRLNPACGQRLEAVVLKALEKDPVRRYQSISAFARALRQSGAEERGRVISPPARWRPAASSLVPFTPWMLESKLGEGSVGEVWLGRHTKTKEARAFKFCADPERLRMLKRETTLFRLLHERLKEHPNIARVYDVSFDDEPHYLMFEHADGGDLAQWSAALGGPVTEAAALSIVAEAADGLQAAHDAGVLHRDIKPSNILMRKSGSPKGATAKLGDFGIGQVFSREQLTGITHWGFTQTVLLGEGKLLGGTHLYMAPELFAGKPASVRSDIYALGAVLYQLLLGDFQRPVTTDWSRDIGDPLLRDILSQCFAGDPRERFSGAAQLAESLRQLPERRTAAQRRREESEEAQRRNRRNKIARAMAAATAVLTAAAAAAYFWVERGRQAGLGVAEHLLSEAAELRQGGLAGQNAESAGRVERAITRLRDAHRLTGKLEEVRSALIASMDLPDLVGLGTRAPSSDAPVIAFSPKLSLQAEMEDRSSIIAICDQDRKLVKSLACPADCGRILFGEFSPLGTHFLAMFGVDRHRTVVLWDLRSGAATFRASDRFGACRLSPQDHFLALASMDGSVSIHETATGKLKHDLSSGNEYDAQSLAWTPDEGRLASASPESVYVHVWDLAGAGRKLDPLYHPAGPVRAVAWDEGGTVLAAGCADGQVYLWDLAHPKSEPWKLSAQEGPVRDLLPSTELGAVFTLGEDQTLRMTSIGQGTSVVGHAGVPGERLELRSKGGEEAILSVWNRKGGHAEYRVREAALSLATPSGSQDRSRETRGTSKLVGLGKGLTAILHNGQIMWHDQAQNSIVGRMKAEGIRELAMAQDGSSLLAAGRQGLFEIPFSQGLDSGRSLFQTREPQATPAPEDLGCIATKGGKYHGLLAHGEHLHSLGNDLTNRSRLALRLNPDKMLVSPDGRWLAVRDKLEGRVLVYALPLGSQSRPVFTSTGRDFDFTEEAGTLLLCHGRAVQVARPGVWQAETSIQFEPHETCDAIAVQPRSGLAAVVIGNSVRWIDHRTGQLILRLDSRDASPIKAAAFSPDGRQFNTLRSNGQFQSWDVPALGNLLEVHGIGHPALGKASSPQRPFGRRSGSLSLGPELPGIPPKSPLAAQVTSAERLEEQVKERPDDIRGRLLLAKIYFDLGDFNAAATHLAQVDPTRRTPDGELLLALSLLKSGRRGDASQHYQAALEAAGGQQRKLPHLWEEAAALFDASGAVSQQAQSK